MILFLKVCLHCDICLKEGKREKKDDDGHVEKEVEAIMTRIES